MFRSRLCSVVLVAALGIVPIGPPEHVHETTDAEGHHVVVAHRHAQLHTQALPAPAGHHTIDHPDPVAFVLDVVYTTPDRYAPPIPGVVVVATPSAPRVRPIAAAPRFSERLIHAPPRAPSSLRAPPFPRFL